MRPCGQPCPYSLMCGQQPSWSFSAPDSLVHLPALRLTTALEMATELQQLIGISCTALQVAGDLHMGRASSDSARPSAFEATADEAPDDVRDSQSDGTLQESELDVRPPSFFPLFTFQSYTL